MNEILLQGVVGSKAYGLDHADSDEDLLGVYLAPTRAFLGLNLPQVNSLSTVHHTPQDSTLHELVKFCKLAANANPTVTELLWLDNYLVTTPEGERLLQLRKDFLSASPIRAVYAGCVNQQLKGFAKATGDLPRRAKRARHIFRLIDQGITAYQTGEIVVKVADPEEMHAKAWAAAESGDVTALEKEAQTLLDVVDHTASPLPESPDLTRVDEFIIDTRINQLRNEVL